MTNPAAGSPAVKTVTLSGLLTREILPGTLGNLVLNLLACWLTFPAGAPVTLRGRPGLALDLLPATVVPALMMTVGLTIMLRRRCRDGLRVSPAPTLPFALPRSIGLRALAVAVIGLGLVAVPTLIALLLLWPAAGTWPQLIAYKCVFSFFHASVLTPIMILAVLADERDRAAGSSS